MNAYLRELGTNLALTAVLLVISEVLIRTFDLSRLSVLIVVLAVGYAAKAAFRSRNRRTQGRRPDSGAEAGSRDGTRR